MTKRLSRADREAMARAIECRSREGGAAAAQIEEMLASEPWEEVGEFAAYACQVASLRLRPWQVPPCAVRVGDVDAPGDEHRAIGAAAKLLRALLALGLSRFEPDPGAALELAETARRVTA
jgi:hypothetical protein